MGAGAFAGGGAADGVGQVVEGDDVASGQDDGAVDGVLQLAHVAGPVVGVEGGDGGVVEAAQALFIIGALQEALGQRRNLFAPLPQRRHVQRQRVDAVKQVEAKRALGAHVRQVAVRGEDDADVERNLFLESAEARDLAGLEHAQQQRLRLGRQLADLVEKHRAAVGRLEDALLVFVGAGERALHVSEQGALQEVAVEGAAVHRDDGLGRARRAAVHQLRDHLFARAGLAGDQDGVGAAGDALDL